MEEFQNTSVDLVNSRKRESTDDDSHGPCTKKIAFGVLLYVAFPSGGGFSLGGILQNSAVPVDPVRAPGL